MLVYNFLMDRLEDYRDTYEGPLLDAIKAATNAVIDKLKIYYSKAGTEGYATATILDPRFKLHYYREHEWEEEWIEEALGEFENAFARYRSSPAPSVRERVPVEWDGVGMEDLVECIIKSRRVTKPDEPSSTWMRHRPSGRRTSCSDGRRTQERTRAWRRWRETTWPSRPRTPWWSVSSLAART